jgi:hypothetical protein
MLARKEKNLFLLLCIIDEKENQIFLIYKEILMGLIAKSYMKEKQNFPRGDWMQSHIWGGAP